MMSSVIYYSNDGRKNEIDSLNHRENSNETVSCYKSLLKCSEALLSKEITDRLSVRNQLITKCQNFLNTEMSNFIV